jgi:co-chaperonin GroES (HSP10)
MQEYVLNKVQFDFGSLDEAFPAVDPGVQPFGSRVLCQIRLAKKKTAGGIILTGDTKDTETWNTQIAKVVSIGSLAFKNRNTQQSWPEGSWCEVGDFVRVPKYGGDKWTVKINDDEEVIFVILNDLDLIGKVTGDPLAMKAFV